LAREEEPDRLVAYVDPGRPNAWRAEPYFSTLKDFAVLFAETEVQVCVYIGRRVFVVLPDKEVDLGIVAEGELILTRRTRTPHGMLLDAFKVAKNQP
jgi:hypothetical protein